MYKQVARTAVIVALVCSVLRLFIDEGNLLYSIISPIEIIASLCCSVFVIRGIIELARSLKNLRMSERGRKLIRLILILTICAYVLRLIASLLTVSQTALVLAFILLQKAVLSQRGNHDAVLRYVGVRGA